MSIVKNTIIGKLGFVKKANKKFMSKLSKVFAGSYVSIVSIISAIAINVPPHQGGFSVLESLSLIGVIMSLPFIITYYICSSIHKEDEINIKSGKIPTEVPSLYSSMSLKKESLSEEDRLNLKKIKQETSLNEIECELIEREISTDGINNQHDYIKLLFKLHHHELLKECSEKNKSDPEKVIGKMIKRLEEKSEYAIVNH